VALALLAAGCGGSRGVTVDVTPRSSLADRPVHVTITGLRPHAAITVDLRSTDARRVTWTASARFRATANGVVDLDTTPPTSGDYAGVWGMGLVMSLRPTRGLRVYSWRDARPLAFTLRVRTDGKPVAEATFERRYSSRPLVRRPTSLNGEGFLGAYVAPAGAPRRPAVLALGGSEGGLSQTGLAQRLAARGYPTLTIAYFGLPGLPPDLAGVRLEYFVRALRWLARRPEVDPRRIYTLGISRGSEAALLLGVHFPRLVYGVVASVPSSVVNIGWTLHGRAVPFTVQFANPHPVDDPRSVIPVERIRGPVFVSCGENDVVWPSCAYAEAIAARRERHHRPVVLHESDAAGHGTGTLAPYAITTALDSRVDEQARERLWPRLLAFLEASS
jgi:dienelactone hydrolase